MYLESVHGRGGDPPDDAVSETTYPGGYIDLVKETSSTNALLNKPFSFFAILTEAAGSLIRNLRKRRLR